MRAVNCYGAALVAMSGKRYSRWATDVAATHRHVPLLQVEDLRAVVPYDCVPVAVELSDEARPLMAYTHPERAFYVFGPEDGSIKAETRSWCRDVVYVPTRFCMNLGVTVAVVLYDRMAKRMAASEMRPAAEISRFTRSAVNE